MSSRTNATQLSDPKECWQMMCEEAQRPVVTDQRLPQITMVNRWLELVGVETQIFRIQTQLITNTG